MWVRTFLPMTFPFPYTPISKFSYRNSYDPPPFKVSSFLFCKPWQKGWDPPLLLAITTPSFLSLVNSHIVPKKVALCNILKKQWFAFNLAPTTVFLLRIFTQTVTAQTDSAVSNSVGNRHCLFSKKSLLEPFKWNLRQTFLGGPTSKREDVEDNIPPRWLRPKMRMNKKGSYTIQDFPI